MTRPKYTRRDLRRARPEQFIDGFIHSEDVTLKVSCTTAPLAIEGCALYYTYDELYNGYGGRTRKKTICIAMWTERFSHLLIADTSNPTVYQTFGGNWSMRKVQALLDTRCRALRPLVEIRYSNGTMDLDPTTYVQNKLLKALKGDGL